MGMNRVRYVIRKKGFGMLQAIIFDVDGTLWNTTDYVAEAWNRAGEEFSSSRNCPITGADLRREFGKTMDVIAENLFPKESKEVQEKILSRCKIYEKETLENISHSLLYPHVKETLQKLSEKYKVYIVSNCQSGYIPLFLEKNELEKDVDDFECYGDTLRYKGENIRLVMERNNITSAIYVGDTMGDFTASQEAEIPFVFARYGFGEVENPEISVDNISEILQIVENLANPNCDN